MATLGIGSALSQQNKIGSSYHYATPKESAIHEFESTINNGCMTYIIVQAIKFSIRLNLHTQQVSYSEPHGT